MVHFAFLGVAAMVLGVAAPACGTAGAPASAPVLDVVTTLYPLAQVAAAVGGDHARVVNVVGDGTNPLSATLDAPGRAALAHAAVVIEVGGGLQPALEEAVRSAGRPRVLTLASSPADAAAGPWLDPGRLGVVARQLAAALSDANPAAAATYANGARDVAAQMSSLSADLHTTLAGCSRHQVVAADGTFAALAAAAGLVNVAVGVAPDPSPGQVAQAAAVIRATRSTVAFREPWVRDATVRAAAGAAGVRVRTLDTLIGAPATGWPRGASYQRLLEADLGVLTTVLSCPSGGTA